MTISLNRSLLLLSNTFFVLAAVSAVTSLLPFIVALWGGWAQFIRSLPYDLLMMLTTVFSFAFLTAFTLMAGLGIRKFLSVADTVSAIRQKLEA